MCACVVVGVGADSTDRRVTAAAVVVSKLLAEFALVCGACRKVFLSLALSPKDGNTIFEEALDVGSVFHSYDT